MARNIEALELGCIVRLTIFVPSFDQLATTQEVSRYQWKSCLVFMVFLLRDYSCSFLRSLYEIQKVSLAWMI